MKRSFGTLPNGKETFLYTIARGGITAQITDFGAALVSLNVPDKDGNIDDVVLGYDDCTGYLHDSCFLGSTVGRSANRIKGSRFCLNGRTHHLIPNEGENNLHSGPEYYHIRLWDVTEHTADSITLELVSPDGDQGFPGKARIQVTYSLDSQGGLHLIYDGICDKDTIFNLTNHSYFNLAGHTQTHKAMDQILSIPGRVFTVADDASVPTGEVRSVADTPMDFRKPKAIGRDIEADYEPLHLQGGFDHNYEVFCNPCAQLADKASGRMMAVYTDLPGIQFYAGNFLKETGKGGTWYGKRSGIALETQFWPDSANHPEWVQPFTRAGERYHTETVYRFTW